MFNSFHKILFNHFTYHSPKTNLNTYFLLRAKCWLRGGVGGQFLRNMIRNLFPKYTSVLTLSMPVNSTVTSNSLAMEVAMNFQHWTCEKTNSI